MSWHAKPSGGYSVGSPAWNDNVDMIYGILADAGFSLFAISGIVGNMQHESGLNPWRWQSDIVSMTESDKGYGLAQFTPAYGYIGGYGVGVAGYGPNMSTSTQTSGARPEDGTAQMIVIRDDKAGKYSVRPWAPERFKVTWSNFKNIQDLEIATGAWLYNYESPTNPGDKLAERYATAGRVYEYITGHPPPPPGPIGGSLPVWLLKMISDNEI